MKKTALILILLFNINPVFASSTQEVCIKYEKEIGWSKGYSVEATIISGSDLNTAVGSFSRFKPFSTYAVVFWDQGQASIFELPPLSMGSAPIFETQVKDQEGRTWKIKEGHTFCQ
jgi:hypothetical protein